MANFSALLSSTYVEWPVINVWNAARHSPKRKLHTARHPRRSTSTNAQPACENKKKEMLDLGDNFDWQSILWHASNGLLARSREETLLLTHEPSFRRQRQWASSSLTGEFSLPQVQTATRPGCICARALEAARLLQYMSDANPRLVPPGEDRAGAGRVPLPLGVPAVQQAWLYMSGNK